MLLVETSHTKVDAQVTANVQEALTSVAFVVASVEVHSTVRVHSMVSVLVTVSVHIVDVLEVSVSIPPVVASKSLVVVVQITVKSSHIDTSHQI
jgi:hypothetical protein